MTEKPIIKKTLGIFSLTCCEGCQFELLNFYDDFSHLLNYFDIKNFVLAQGENLPGPFDVALVEGTPETVEEIELLKLIRKQSTTVVALGTCAHLGGIQAQRNYDKKHSIRRQSVMPISKLIKVDYIIPGCPINRYEAYQVLVDLYFKREPIQIIDPVCFECRHNQVKCLLKAGEPCLGPVSRGGCEAICTKHGFVCLGCRGPVVQTNLYKIREMFKDLLSPEEIEKRLEIYGEFKEMIEVEKK